MARWLLSEGVLRNATHPNTLDPLSCPPLHPNILLLLNALSITTKVQASWQTLHMMQSDVIFDVLIHLWLYNVPSQVFSFKSSLVRLLYPAEDRP